MTDYLEELLAGADELLEQVKRLERGLPANETRDFLEESMEINWNKFEVNRETDIVDQSKKEVYEPDFRRFLGETVYAEETKRPEEMKRAAEMKQTEETKQSEEPEKTETSKAQLVQEESQMWTEKSALLEELERAGQMSTAARTEATIKWRKTQEDFAVPSRADRRPFALREAEQTGGGAAGSGLLLPLPGQTLDWAEQADRVFRRDSRRYDGGFCLY